MMKESFAAVVTKPRPFAYPCRTAAGSGRGFEPRGAGTLPPESTSKRARVSVKCLRAVGLSVLKRRSTAASRASTRCAATQRCKPFHASTRPGYQVPFAETKIKIGLLIRGSWSLRRSEPSFSGSRRFESDAIQSTRGQQPWGSQRGLVSDAEEVDRSRAASGILPRFPGRV